MLRIRRQASVKRSDARARRGPPEHVAQRTALKLLGSGFSHCDTCRVDAPGATVALRATPSHVQESAAGRTNAVPMRYPAASIDSNSTVSKKFSLAADKRRHTSVPLGTRRAVSSHAGLVLSKATAV